jgi:hypothetical protein
MGPMERVNRWFDRQEQIVRLEVADVFCQAMLPAEHQSGEPVLVVFDCWRKGLHPADMRTIGRVLQIRSVIDCFLGDHDTEEYWATFVAGREMLANRPDERAMALYGYVMVSIEGVPEQKAIWADALVDWRQVRDEYLADDVLMGRRFPAS